MIEHVKINIRERRRSNTMQRNWQHMVRKTKKNKAKTQHTVYWTPLWIWYSYYSL